jgi:inosine-uridine nucleoside N-ribohydrolase
VQRLIHLDTDIGGDVDDLCALVMLLGWEGVELAGITTMAESGGLRAGFARYVLRLAQRDDIQVSAGAAGSLGGFPTAPWSNDPLRYWPEPIPPQPAAPGAALALMAESIARSATVAGVGPYTNLALLEAIHPDLLASTSVVLMGGTVAPPRHDLPPWGPDMDWNVQSDAIAARIVFERCNPLIVPLDISLQVTMREAHLPALRASGPLGRLLADQAEMYAKEWNHRALSQEHAGLPDDFLNFHHDPLACAVAAGWDGVTIEEMKLTPELRGQSLTFVPGETGKPTRVVRQVDPERFSRDWLTAVERADRLAGR